MDFTIQALNIFETSLRRGKFDESRVYDVNILFLKFLLFPHAKLNLEK